MPSIAAICAFVSAGVPDLFLALLDPFLTHTAEGGGVCILLTVICFGCRKRTRSDDGKCRYRREDMTFDGGIVDRLTKCSGTPSWKEIKMLRVSKREERWRTVLIVDGRLWADYVQVVETCCNEAISTGAIIHLYLRDVTTVDGAGRALLSRLAAKGVHLSASGSYTSQLIRDLIATTEQSANRGHQEAPRRPRTDSPSDE